MTAYNKLIAVVVGLAVMLAARYGIDLTGQEQVIVDVVISVLTAAGVYQAKNS